MVKSEAKRKQSICTSTSTKTSKAKPSLHSQKCKPPSPPPAVETIDSKSEQEVSANVAVESGQDTETTGDSDSSFESAPSLKTSNLASSQSKTTPVVSSTLSSTITKWMSKKATTSTDQNTWRLFGQLAMAIPLQASSQFDKACEEAVRGLNKAS